MKLSVQDLVLYPCFVYRHLQRIQNLITHRKSLGVCQGFFLSDTVFSHLILMKMSVKKVIIYGGEAQLLCAVEKNHPAIQPA